MTLFWLYFMLDDHKASVEYFDWYQSEFPDDMGEPIQHLSWALALHRMGNAEEATDRLAKAMLSNLYMIPLVLGRNVGMLRNRQSSNYEEREYIEECPEEVFLGINDEDRDWLALHYDSLKFAKIRKEYLEIDTALEGLEVGPKRSKLVKQLFEVLRNPTSCA